MKLYESTTSTKAEARVFFGSVIAPSSTSEYVPQIEVTRVPWIPPSPDRTSKLYEGLEGDSVSPAPRESFSFPINKLATKNLNDPILIKVEPDDDGFIAKCLELPVYGFAGSARAAIDTLKAEIETLYEDLMEDDQFTDDWLEIKTTLIQKVGNG